VSLSWGSIRLIFAIFRASGSDFSQFDFLVFLHSSSMQEIEIIICIERPGKICGFPGPKGGTWGTR
jgi:hypothetical protein